MPHLPCPATPEFVGVAGFFCCRMTLPLWYHVGACLLCRPPTLPLVCLLAPYPPTPSPGGDGGDFFVFFAGGFAPGTPALNRLRHLQSLPLWYPEGACPRRHWLDLPIRHSTGACLRHRQFGAKPIEQPFYWRCRQPRRGGTGGDGTIRRKRRRRLRWSSPPGQGEQVPRGGKPPCAPAGYHSGRVCKCRRGSAPGMQGAKPLA